MVRILSVLLVVSVSLPQAQASKEDGLTYKPSRKRYKHGEREYKHGKLGISFKRTRTLPSSHHHEVSLHDVGGKTYVFRKTKTEQRIAPHVIRHQGVEQVHVSRTAEGFRVDLIPVDTTFGIPKSSYEPLVYEYHKDGKISYHGSLSNAPPNLTRKSDVIKAIQERKYTGNVSFSDRRKEPAPADLIPLAQKRK